MKDDNDRWIGKGRKPMVAVCVERNCGYGSVPGLENEELADPAELERQVVFDEWGPILALPVDRNGSWIRPNIDEKGEVEWGAFGTHDFERLYGSFDKARYKVDKLRMELRNAVIMMETAAARVPESVVGSLMAGLRSGTVDPEDIEDWNQYFFALRYLRVKRIRKEIQDLRNLVYRRRAQAAALTG